MTDAKVIDCAVDWYMARTRFLKLPAGDAETRKALNDLSNAENALSLAVRDGVSKAFGETK